MARTLYRLTDRLVRSLMAPGYHADGGGLYLQVSPAGTKSWVFRFTLRGRTRDMGFGSANDVALAAVRVRSAECRLLLAKGLDPIDQAKAEREAVAEPAPVAPRTTPTFLEFAEQFIGAREAGWRNAKHRAQWRATLVRYAYPKIGSLGVDEIDTPHILGILEPMWPERSETASRLRGRIERILASAAVRGLRPATNPAAWVGHLKEALPSKKPSVPFAAMPYAEIPTFMTKLRQCEGVGARALEFAILTVSRSGEARGALWSEIDLPAKEWIVPASRMKAGRPHTVPLSDGALAVIGGMKPLRDLDGGFLFPGIKSGKALSDATLNKVVHSLGYHFTVHGFRSALKTWAEQETQHSNVVIEATLAHLVGDEAERSYMRGDWRAKRRTLLADWGAYCASAPVSSVVPLHGDQVAAA